MTTDRPVNQCVREIITSVLQLEEHEAVPSARFFADLDGESIDLLDLQFQVEKQLDVKVEFNSLLAGGNVVTDERGIVTPATLRYLSETYPFLSVAQLPPNPTSETLKDLLTVATITRFVELAVTSPATASDPSTSSAHILPSGTSTAC